MENTKKIRCNPRWIVEGIEQDLWAQMARATWRGYQAKEYTERTAYLVLPKKLDWSNLLFLPLYIPYFLFIKKEQVIMLDLDRPVDSDRLYHFMHREFYWSDLGKTSNAEEVIKQEKEQNKES